MKPNSLTNLSLQFKTTGFIVLSLFMFSCKNQKVDKIEKQPNIIVFLVDDMGWQDTSVQFWDKKTPLNNLYNTPNMERLANEGMKFTQAYANAVCTPTRVSLISGMNAASHRVTNWTYVKGCPTDAPDKKLKYPQWNFNGAQPVDTIKNSIQITALPKLLKESGYYTIHSGKAHFGTVSTPGENPLNFGFDVNIGGHGLGSPGSYYGTDNFQRKTGKKTMWDTPGLEKYHGKDIFLTEALTKEAIVAMDSAVTRQQPFYLYMSHYAVHAPIQGDSRFEGKYADKAVDAKEAKYASLVEGMDKSLGDIMNYLEKKNLSENTVILFMSDNGGLSAVIRGGEKNTHNKPLSSGKGSAHEGGIREPMIVKWPGVTKPNTSTDNCVIIEDFFPTILQMAKVENYETIQEIDGKSFVPVLEGKLVSNDRPMFWHFPNNWGPIGPGIGASSTVRKGDWKLIYYHVDRKFELFNLKNDIGELKNLASQEKQKLKELATLLGTYLRDKKAQMPFDIAENKQVEWPDEVVN